MSSGHSHDAAALSGSSPYWFDMLAIKIALLSKNYFIGAPWGTRTPNLRIRSARLYPIELMALAKLTIMIIHYLIVLCQSIFLLFISLSLSVPWMESRSFLFSCRAISVCWIWECTWNTISLPYLLCPKECLFFLWCALSRWQMSRHHPRKTACIYGRLPWSCLTGRSETMCISLKMIMTASFGIIPHRCRGI